MRGRRRRHGDGAAVGERGDGREEEEEAVDVAGEEGDGLAVQEAREQREEQRRGEDLHGRETRVHPAEVAGGEVEAVVLGRVDEPHRVDGVLAALDNGVEAVHDAGDEHVALADELQVAALVELQDVAVVDRRHVVGVHVHQRLQLVVARLRLLTLGGVLRAHLLGEALAEEDEDGDEDQDGEHGAQEAGEEQGVLGLRRRRNRDVADPRIGLH